MHARTSARQILCTYNIINGRDSSFRKESLASDSSRAPLAYEGYCHGKNYNKRTPRPTD